MNNYEVAEIVEIGKAHDVILGGIKGVVVFDDSPGEGFRDTLAQDDE